MARLVRRILVTPMRALALIVALLAPLCAAARPLDAKLPTAIRAITGTYARSDGPNCLNAVALWHGLTKKKAWTSWRALDRHLQDPSKFRQLASREAPRLGDVIVYRHGPRDLIEHGSIYLDADHVWEKASADRVTPWQITPRDVPMREYAHRTVIEYYRPALSDGAMQHFMRGGRPLATARR